MKKLSLLGMICGVLLATGCATTQPAAKTDHRPPTTTDSPSANLLVISAAYGSGINFADVTYRVNDLLHQPEVEFFARPEWLRADPTPGWNKALVIVFEHKGKRHIFTTGEGGRVSIDALLDSKNPKPGSKRPKPAKAENRND